MSRKATKASTISLFYILCNKAQKVLPKSLDDKITHYTESSPVPDVLKFEDHAQPMRGLLRHKKIGVGDD